MQPFFFFFFFLKANSSVKSLITDVTGSNPYRERVDGGLKIHTVLFHKKIELLTLPEGEI